MEYAILNGETIKREDARIDMEDRGYQFGDGVYEVIRVFNGKMFTLGEHLQRLQKSSESLSISLPFTSEKIAGMLEELIEKNNLKNGMVYMQVTRGISPRNHSFPEEKVMPMLTANTKEVERPVGLMKNGVSVVLTEDIRWLRCDIKSLNLLGNILAKQKASENGCFEAIQHRSGDVTEGSTSNVLIVKNGVVITHQSDHFILKGITKDVLLELCMKNNIPVEERTFTLGELAEADEVFLTSTTAEVMPIVEIDRKNVAGGVPGPVTRKLQALFTLEIEKQCGVLTEKLNL